jgi:membrane protein DedA with SNARE-associated domain
MSIVLAMITRRRVLVAVGVVVLVAAAAWALHALAGNNSFSLVEVAQGDWAYLSIFLLVFGDAICALLPGETTLNAASTLAADGHLELELVMLAGALGAVLGDSALYWIARASGSRMKDQVAKANENAKVRAALDFIGSSAPLLLLVGRYVPGLRFAINASFGLSAFPYRRFLLWSAIGGTIWSVYTCGLAYLVGTALSQFPLASIVISGAITTAAIAVIFFVVHRRRRRGSEGTPAGVPLS